MNAKFEETKALIGSLSNDLFRVATLSQRGSTQAAQRFLAETKRWTKPLQKHPTPQYISDIIQDISKREVTDTSLESAEKYLMYGILLQNYALHYSGVSSST